MSETEQKTELTDAQKAELATREKEARMWARVTQDEATKAEIDQTWKGLAGVNSKDGREFVRKQCGFDPGWAR